MRFEKFLNDNDAKRVRASRKAAEEIKLREEKVGSSENFHVLGRPTDSAAYRASETGSATHEKETSFRLLLRQVSLTYQNVCHDLNNIWKVSSPNLQTSQKSWPFSTGELLPRSNALSK